MIRLLGLMVLGLLMAMPARADVEIAEVTSPGGITAWLVEEHSIPFAAIEIRFEGGASLDAPGKRGATNLMMALLEEGAGDIDARGFSEAREALAASYDFDTYADSVTISARFLTENREQAVALLRLALTVPRFDEDAVERVRGQVLSNIRSDQQDPSQIANNAFNAAVFGDHPYATALDGTLDSVAGLTRDDMLEAKARVMARDRVFVGAVGDITAAELGTVIDELLGGLPETGASMPGRAEFEPEGGTEVVPFNTPQSIAIFGHEGIPRDDPDFFAAFVMNQILGAGGFASRLTEELREKRGLTYGISTFLVPMDHAELYLGKFASSNDRIAEAIEVVRTEWQRMAEEDVSAEELQDAITYLTGAYPLRFDGNSTIANILVGMQMEGLDRDYINTRNDKVRAVTVEDVSRVARRMLDPDGLFFIVVGQPAGLESTN